MDLDLRRVLARFGLRPRGVVHVGAHHGQERAIYEACEIACQLYIEPQAEAFEVLEASLPRQPRVRAVKAACGPVRGRAAMHRLSGNHGKSNSLLEPTLHLERWPQFKFEGTTEVDVAPLDEIVADHPEIPADLIVLDVQGYEVEVLRGGARALAGACAVVSEVAAAPLYRGGCTVSDLDLYLGTRGFARVATKWSSGVGGDALYARRARLTIAARVQALLGRRGPPRSARDWLRDHGSVTTVTSSSRTGDAV